METITEITLYRDFGFSKEWGDTLGSYDLQIIGEKARVVLNSIFGLPQQSRLNKFRQVGSVSNVGLYHIIANKQDVYFKLDKTTL